MTKYIVVTFLMGIFSAISILIVIDKSEKTLYNMNKKIVFAAESSYFTGCVNGLENTDLFEKKEVVSFCKSKTKEYSLVLHQLMEE